ncbi:MAG: energy-coupling factor transporter transmembrane component T [Pseudoflavonifractor sp.]
MKSMPTGQYRPGESPLHRAGAGVKLAGLILLLVGVVTAHAPWSYALLIALSAGLICLSGLGFAEILRPIGRLWRFFLVIFLMNALFFTGERALWSWWIFTLSTGGMVQGANVILRVALLMVLTGLLTATTPPMALTAAMASMLMPLRIFRVPTEDVALILGVAIRFIPILMEEADLIRMAQTARGAKFESRRLTDRAKSLLPLVVPIFLAAFRRADELATAMEARGYCSAAEKKNRK